MNPKEKVELHKVYLVRMFESYNRKVDDLRYEMKRQTWSHMFLWLVFVVYLIVNGFKS